MTNKLRYLLREIAFGMEIYYRGRSTAASFKSAFILCDDYTELVTKLYLLENDPQWKGGYGNYEPILKEAAKALAKHPDIARVKRLQGEMVGRRKWRNNFFHSTDLLELTLGREDCVNAYLDLCEYGRLLFWKDDAWERTASGVPNFETLHLLLRVERQGFTRIQVRDRLETLLRDFPQNSSKHPKKGSHVVYYPNDDHLITTVVYADEGFRASLKSLLDPP